MSEFYVNGQLNVQKLLSIPRDQRIVAQATQNYPNMVAVLSIAAGMFLSSSGIDDDTAIALAETIVSEAHEDHLSVQDVIVFLKGAAAGKYGRLSWGKVTVNALMDMFEQYRQGRHEYFMNLKEEQHAQYKAMGRGVSAEQVVREFYEPGVIKSMIEQIHREHGEQQEGV